MYLTIVKTVTELTVAAGVSTIVGTVIKQALPENLSKVKKVTTLVGSIALSGMAGAAASKYATDQIDVAVEAVKVGFKVGDKLKDKKVVIVDVTEEDKTVPEDPESDNNTTEKE